MIQTARYRSQLIQSGVSAAEADRIVAEAVREDAALNKGFCPKCARRISRKIDPRQVGMAERPGTWFNYRCKCGYACDRKERRLPTPPRRIC